MFVKCIKVKKNITASGYNKNKNTECMLTQHNHANIYS